MKNIMEVLYKYQTENIKLKKDAENPFFKSNYITLDNILNHYLPKFTEDWILCFHNVLNSELITSLIHIESWEQVASNFPLHNDDPQKQGSEITYGKRYNLSALLNIQTDLDDDGNLASSAGNTKQFYTKTTNKVTPSDDKKWFNEPELEKFKENNVYWDIDSALKAIRTKYKLGKPMEEKVRKLYEMNPDF